MKKEFGGKIDGGHKPGSAPRSEWSVNQYRIKTDKRCGIINDTNESKRPDFKVRLIKKILTDSLETVGIVNNLSR
jgi:predicted helicase